MSLYKDLQTPHKYDKIINNRLKEYHINFPRIESVLNKPQGVPDKIYGSVNHPIHMTTTYAQYKPGKPYNKYDYSRCGNPSVDSFEQQMAKIEFAKYGISFSSGCAAMNALFTIFKPGDHIISCDDVYGGTNRMLRKVLVKFGIEVSFVDMHHLEKLEKEIKPNTKLIWIETPTNPLLTIIDISAVVKMVKDKNILVAIDNTFASPILQSPMLLGVDVVLHSCTKYIGGFSDIVAGVMVLNNKEIYDKVFFNLMTNGGCLAPMEAFLLQRSLKTLKLRVEQSCFNAEVIVDVLRLHKAVEKVFFPGLDSHKGYEICKQQMRKPGAMVSFNIKASDEKANEVVENFVSNLKLIILAESLGSSKTMVNIPSKMTHTSIAEEERLKLGITNKLVRLTVGLENIKDILDDLTQALDLVLENEQNQFLLQIKFLIFY